MRLTTPIFASEATAAELLDLKLPEFRSLVAAGYLPDGREIAPGLKRWNTQMLQRIDYGGAISGMSGVEW